MKSFDAYQGIWREYAIKVTLQSGEYKGDFEYKMQGNISPYYALSSIDPSLGPVEPSKNNCGYKESEDAVEDYWFEALLKNEKGDTCRVEDLCDCLENYIVALEIADCRECKI